METRCEKIALEDGGFVEKATIVFQGQEFAASGASEWTDKRGRRCFGLYIDWTPESDVDWSTSATLTTSGGDQKFPCHLSRPWRSNFGDKRRAVYMRYMGKEYSGILYSEDWNMWVKLTERKNQR
jgi:hypothetical protein